MAGKKCDVCQANYWAYTSFGCKECGCDPQGSVATTCDSQTGTCECKPGFGGDRCNVCPDGMLVGVAGCKNNDIGGKRKKNVLTTK